MASLNFGVLDFGYRNRKQSSMHSILDVIDLAQLADELGFSNFWLTEHHNFDSGSPWSSPRMMLPLLLEYTNQIAIGTAGVLINFYSPYQVALDFKLLDNLYPGRCHLGFANGRPSPSIGRRMRCEEFSRYPDDFDDRLAEVANLFNNEKDIQNKEHLLLPPAFGTIPALFALGSSFRHYNKAIAAKANMVKSTFHNLDCLDYEEYDVIARYRDGYYREHGEVPRAIIAFSGSCVPDEATRRDVTKQMAEANSGRPIVNSIIATPDEFSERVLQMSTRYGITDFVVREVGQYNDQQKVSLELIHETFGLTASPSHSVMATK